MLQKILVWNIKAIAFTVKSYYQCSSYQKLVKFPRSRSQSKTCWNLVTTNTQVKFQSSSTSGWNVLARLNRPSTELQNSEMIICCYFMFTVINSCKHQRKILVSKKQWELKNYLVGSLNYPIRVFFIHKVDWLKRV